MSGKYCQETNTLKRMRQTGLNTYIRARERRIDWPPNNHEQKHVQNVRIRHRDMALEDSFNGVVQLMSQITHQCEKYHRHQPPKDPHSKEACHRKRFHSPEIHTHKSSNPVHHKTPDDINIAVDPGRCVIAADNQGTIQQKKSHLVNMKKGETVQLKFVL